DLNIKIDDEFEEQSDDKLLELFKELSKNGLYNISIARSRFKTVEEAYAIIESFAHLYEFEIQKRCIEKDKNNHEILR
ncbi:38217_t:CDS:2, partial [Gigaspora margarita]